MGDMSFRKEMKLKMEGRLPMEREHPKEGQSQWYYVDPRGRSKSFSALSEMKTIDVPTKDTPNPYLQEIIEAEANKNPENFYIWKTVSDDRVRSSHAERDGEIFEWSNPPTGGHPGDDYNCRCTAETYKPGRYKRKPNVAKNLKRLLETMKEHLKKVEKSLDYIYLDTKGVKTIGPGINVDNWEDFKKINTQVGERPATENEKLAAFNDFEELKKQGYWGQNITANKFEFRSNLRISEEESDRLLNERLEKDLQKLVKDIPEFTSYPFELQQVLMDLKYNTGNAGPKGWKFLYDGISRKDLPFMAGHTNRPDVGKERNEWARDKILSIKNW